MTLTAMLQRWSDPPRGTIVQADPEPFESVAVNIWDLAGRAVAVAADGRTSIVWQRRLGYSDSQLAARAFDAAGAPLTEAEALMSPGEPREWGVRDRSCAVVQGAGGGVVGWVHTAAVSSDSTGKVLARTFDADLAFRGEPIEIAAAGRELRMAAHQDGSWTALWIAPAERGDRQFAEHLFARRFDANGQPLGTAVRLSGEAFRDALAPILPESTVFRCARDRRRGEPMRVLGLTPRAREGRSEDRGVWYPGVFVQRFAGDWAPIGSPAVVESSRREWTFHGGELAALRVAVGPDGRILVVLAAVEPDPTVTLPIRARMLPVHLVMGPPTAAVGPSAGDTAGEEAAP